MAFWTREPKQTMEVISLQEVVDRFDIVQAADTHMVVAPRSVALDELPPGASELGTTGNSSYGAMLREEYNPELRGLLGLQKFDKMRRGDAQVRSTLRMVKTPVLAARWYIQPSSNRPKDVKIADFVWKNLTQRMSVSWPQFLTESMCYLDYGHYAFEKVFDIGPDGLIYWKKFAARHPFDLERWDYDANGGPNGGYYYGDGWGSSVVFIPIEKLVVFVNDQEANDLNGISVLRSAYKHWYYKDNLYKVDAIQKERHGIGIPIIKLPPNYSADDKRAADQLGRNLRTNEKAHVVLPPMWEIMFAKLEGQPVDCMRSIEHHDTQIARNILAFFLSDTPGAGVGDPQQLFFKGTRFVAEVIKDGINKWAIPELVRLNWGDNVEPPELRVRRIGDTVDWRQISFALRNFVGSGIIKPDDQLEAWIRDEMDLPVADPSTARDVGTPQQPGTPMTVEAGSQAAKALVPGQPKQSTAKGMKIDAGNKNVGGDGAGASG